AKAAFVTLAEAATHAENTLARAEQAVGEAADAILAERAPEILAEAQALANMLGAKLTELQFVGDVLARVGSARRLRIVAASPDSSAAIVQLNAASEDHTAKAIARFIAEHVPPDAPNYQSDPHCDDLRRARAALMV